MSWPVCAAASKAASKIEGRGGDGGNAALAVSTDCNFEFPCIAEHSEYCPETARTYRRAHASTHAHTRLLLFPRRRGIPRRRGYPIHLGPPRQVLDADRCGHRCRCADRRRRRAHLPLLAERRLVGRAAARTAGPSVARRPFRARSGVHQSRQLVVWSGLVWRCRSVPIGTMPETDRASRPRADRPTDRPRD